LDCSFSWLTHLQGAVRSSEADDPVA